MLNVSSAFERAIPSAVAWVAGSPVGQVAATSVAWVTASASRQTIHVAWAAVFAAEKSGMIGITAEGLAPIDVQLLAV